MTALLALVRKDLLLFVGDRRALLLNLIMPIVLGAFFGYLFGGSGASNTSKIEIAVVSQDNNNGISQKIVAGLKADTSLTVVELPLEDATARVLKGKLNAAIVIPAGFGEAAGAARDEVASPRSDRCTKGGLVQGGNPLGLLPGQDAPLGASITHVGTPGGRRAQLAHERISQRCNVG